MEAKLDEMSMGGSAFQRFTILLNKNGILWCFYCSCVVIFWTNSISSIILQIGGCTGNKKCFR